MKAGLRHFHILTTDGEPISNNTWK